MSDISIGIVWDRPPAPGNKFINPDEALGCSINGNYCSRVQLYFRSGGRAHHIPEQFIPDELEHHCHAALMAAGALFERLT